MKTPFHNECFNLKSTNLFKTITLLALGALLAGCPAGKNTSEQAPGEKIVIKGSNTVGEELAPRLIAEYKKTHPAVAIAIETKGSGSGFWGLIAGVCDIAAASRPMIQDELQQAQVRGIELNDYVIGSYVVAVVVNAANPVQDLTRAQVRDIFTGAIQNWKEVGGADAPIHLYIRDPISGTYLGFRELALEDKPYVTNARELVDYGRIAQAVAKDAQGIGYATIQLASQAGVKGVSIAGVAPAVSSVQAGKYPFARVLHFYTDKGKESTATREFVQFVQSAPGQQIVEQVGFVRRP